MAAHTVMGSSVVIHGSVAGDGDVTVNGRLDGSVELMATLNVGPAARIRADLSVTRAVIAGIVVGNITAKEAVELLAGARVVGDVITPRFIMADGALFRGAVRESGTHARSSSPPPMMPARQAPRDEPQASRPALTGGRVDLLRSPSQPPRDEVLSRSIRSAPRAPSRPPFVQDDTALPVLEPVAPRARPEPREDEPSRVRAAPAAPRVRPPRPAPPPTEPDDAEDFQEAASEPPPPRPASTSRPPPLTPPEARPLPGRGQKRKVVVKRR